MSDPKSSPSLLPQIDALIAAVSARLQQIQAERANLDAEERELRARLPGSEDSGLPSAVDYALINSMDASTIDSKNAPRRPGVRLKSSGPVAKVAKTLGISRDEVARRIGENIYSVRSWDSRGRVPDDVRTRLDDLLAAHRQKPTKPGKK